MGNEAPTGDKVDRRIEAEPVIRSGWRVQPVARLIGWESDGAEQLGPFMSRVGRLTPLEIQVDGDSDAEQEIITIEDPGQEPLRGIFMAGAAVSVICLLIMLAARVATLRR